MIRAELKGHYRTDARYPAAIVNITNRCNLSCRHCFVFRDANPNETPESIHVELEVPGLKSDQLDISVVGDQLSIKIERSGPTEENVTYHRRERPVGTFLRMVQLPAEVDANRVEAELQHGVLTIELPKAEAAKPRKIQVTSAS